MAICLMSIWMMRPKPMAIRTGYEGYFEAPGTFVQAFIKDNVVAIVAAITAGLGQSLIEQVKCSIQQDAANRC